MENLNQVKLPKKRWVKKLGWITISMLVILVLPVGIRTVYAATIIQKAEKKNGFLFEKIKNKVMNFFVEKKDNEVTLSKKRILITSLTTITVILVVSLCYQSQPASLSKQLATKKMQELAPALLPPVMIANTASWEFLKANKTVGFSKTIINPLVPLLLNSDFQKLLKKQIETENITNLIFAFKEFKGI